MTDAPTNQRSAETKLTPRKKWLFRLGAVLLGLSLLGVAEAICFLGGWGKPTDYPDPYVGFSEIHPLFVKDAAGENYVIPKSRRGFFAPDSFPAKKGPDTFRVFCFGGSTVQGRPYSIPTSFPTWLRLSLTAGDSRKTWEVVNCGGVSYASYRLAPIVRECLDYQPDLFIICTGHNEFLEERTYSHIKDASPVVSVPARTLSRLRTVTLLRSAINDVTGRGAAVSEERPELKSEVDALLDYNNGLKAYHRDEELRQRIIEHFEFNLRRMIDFARGANVPVILVLPPSNLRNTPPFKSQHKAGLSDTEKQQWKSLMDRAGELYRNDLPAAAELLEQAAGIDDRHAGTAYELGRVSDAMWQRTKDAEPLRKARAAYVRARDLDICPLRMITPLEEAMRAVADETQTPLIDAHALLEAECPGNIMDDTMLVDHIHPSPTVGHQRIAHALALLMAEREWFRSNADWKVRRTTACATHLKSLPELYFPHGRRTLESLRAWTEGRASGPPIETRLKGSRDKRANER